MTHAERKSRSWLATTTAITAGGIVILLGGALLRFGSVSTALAYASGQRLIVDASTKSFGEVDAGRDQTVLFNITNLSREPIGILGASSSCRCTVADDLPLTIPPSGRQGLRVTVTTDSREGVFEEAVRFFTDYKEHPQIIVKVVGRVHSKNSIVHQDKAE